MPCAATFPYAAASIPEAQRLHSHAERSSFRLERLDSRILASCQHNASRTADRCRGETAGAGDGHLFTLEGWTAVIADMANRGMAANKDQRRAAAAYLAEHLSPE